MARSVSKKAVPPSTSHAEFETLPNSVQRKYFSELERLRIADEHRQHQIQQLSQARRRSHCPSLPVPSTRSLHLTLRSTRRRLRKAESLRQEHELSYADAQFFLSLPEKLQKQHFSIEEQILLIARAEQAVFPEDPVYNDDQRFHDFHFDFFDQHDTTPPSRGRTRRRSTSVSPRRLSPSTCSLQQDQGPLRLSGGSRCPLDNMTPPLSQQAMPPYRRTMSLTNIPFRHSTSSAPPIASPPLFPLGPQPWRSRASSQSHRPESGRRSSHAPVAPVFDPEATHYQDPEARKKLRMFLASPQKFDEAVEFGFPSTAGDDTVAPRYELPPITTDARNFSRDVQTFLRDDKISFLEGIEDQDVPSDSDGESATDDSPVTPSSVGLSFRGHTRYASPSKFSSLDSTGLPPMHPITGRLNREMTLRMTLTRPDLRADEDQLYGWQGQGSDHRPSKDDPFALEELTFSDDMTGAKGAFAVKPKQGNLVTRLFKRASKKSW
ncbi:hypothetical protein EJ04DRAFT_484622 [Polyplosphaeria fusca]|uniref:Uncharacterized protein n=1 Tax=Polyplosphaeria fusca TaxID=682080 RepID=A0A9P4R5F9_9PLEO|nr:hypothetical protein EJ04DRAFT_484622 [Polyplosphaeria fusca]